MKVDANRSAINALGEQSAARFARVEQQVARVEQRVARVEQQMDTGFAEMRGKLDQAAAGQGQIATLLNTLITRGDDR